MEFFITGGCGFIGSNYVGYLLDSTLEVSKITVFDKLTYAANLRNLEKYQDDSRLQVIIGDICDFPTLKTAMNGHDVVIHFAAESHVDRSILDSKTFIETNLTGTYNVLEACRVNSVRTTVHVSTDEVYGSFPEGTANENDVLLPNSPYAASKAGSDLLARSYFVTHGLDIRITRCCNNYGKFQFPEKVIPVFIKSLLSGKKTPIYGNGMNTREWIHVKDHCRGIQVVLENGTPGEIYNIGTGVHLTNIDLANQIIKILGEKSDSIEFIEDRKGHDFRYSLNYEKIAKIGFSAQINFEEGLTDTIDWYKANQSWWG